MFMSGLFAAQRASSLSRCLIDPLLITTNAAFNNLCRDEATQRRTEPLKPTFAPGFKGPILWKVRFSFFLIIKQVQVFYKYSESIKTLDPRGNAPRPFSETVFLKDAVWILCSL